MPHGQLWCRENRLSLNRHKGQFFAGDREAFLHVGNSTGDHPKSAATGERRTLTPGGVETCVDQPLIRQGAFTLIRVRTIRNHLEREPHGRNLGVAVSLFRIGEQLEGLKFLLEMRRSADEEIPPCFERFQVERLLRFVNVQHLVAKATRDRTPVQGFWLGQLERLEIERQARLDHLTRQEAADEETRKAWRELWEPAGIVPLPPAEMRTWLERHSRLLERLEAYSEAKHQLVEQRAAEESTRAAMRTALEALGETAPAADLINLRQHADRVVSDAAEQAHRREALVAQEETHSGALDKTQTERDQVERDLDMWRADWDDAIRRLTLGPDALPEEAESLLERIDELEHNLDQREALGRRSFGIERDAEKFGDKVNALVSEWVLAPAAVDRSPSPPSSWVKPRVSAPGTLER